MVLLLLLLLLHVVLVQMLMRMQHLLLLVAFRLLFLPHYEIPLPTRRPPTSTSLLACLNQLQLLVDRAFSLLLLQIHLHLLLEEEEQEIKKGEEQQQ